MHNSFFNLLDYLYILLMLLSSLTGFVRGVTKEILSLASWIGAGLVAIIVAPFFYPFIDQYIENSKISHKIAIGLGYIASLIVLLVISNLISQSVKNSSLSNIDRSLGVIFGLLRSMFIILLVAIAILLFNIKVEKQTLLKESQITKFTYAIAEDLLPSLEKYQIVAHIMKQNRSNRHLRKSKNPYLEKSIQHDISKISTQNSNSIKAIKHLHKSDSILNLISDIRIN